MRSAADRSAACRASNVATGSTRGRLPASGAAESRAVATTAMGMRDSRSGAFNYSRRTIPPLVSFGDYIYEYLFASPFPFHARCFHRSAVSIPPNSLRCSRSRHCFSLVLKSRRSFRKSRGKSATRWSVELVELDCREVSRTTCRNVVVPL